MLTLDGSRVKDISRRRFVHVLEQELLRPKGDKPAFASASNPGVVRLVRNTLRHSVSTLSREGTSGQVFEQLNVFAELEATIPQELHQIPTLSAQLDHFSPSVGDVAVVDNPDKHTSVVHDATPEAAAGERIQSLLQDQKDLSAKDLEVEQRTQAMLIEELTELTSILKESTLEINRAVNVQNLQLTAMSGYAAENRDELESQKKRMKESTTVMSTSIWSTVWLIIWVLLMFSGGYAVIRLFPAPRDGAFPTCPNSPPSQHGEL